MKTGSWLGPAAMAVALLFSAPACAATFDPNPDARVAALLPLANGELLVGGDFNHIGGVERHQLARLKADGSVDAAFTLGVTGPSPTVLALVRQTDGKIVLAGAFSAVGGQTTASVARLNTDGSVDSGFAVTQLQGGNNWPAVLDVALQPDGKILIAGIFDQVGGTRRVGVARLNADGSIDASFVPASNDGNGGSVQVNALALQTDGKIVLGGGSLNLGDTSRRLLRLNPNGSLDAGFSADVGGGSVTDILMENDGSMLISGDFTTAVSITHPNLARLRANGTLDDTFSVSADQRVNQFLRQSDGKVLVGGGFSQIGGQTRWGVARLNADGSVDTGFKDARLQREGYPGFILTLAQQDDGRIAVGGDFDAVGAYPRKRMTRLNADGSIDIPEYTVTPTPATHGVFSPAQAQRVREGETTQFVIVPDAGYHLDGIDGCGGTLQGALYVTAPVMADCAISASFAAGEQTFTITPAPGPHGHLSPATAQSVPFGHTIDFAVSADAGYYLDAIAGCGGHLDGDVFTIAPAGADCSVTASFVAPAQIAASGPAQQSTAAGTPFAAPLAVRVTTADGRPIAGADVRFQAPASGASAVLSATTARTDANGAASVTAIANDVGGAYTVTASVGTLSATFQLANKAVDGPGIELRVTVSTEPPPACGSATELDVVAGTPVNYCFTVINHSPAALNVHSLSHWPQDYFWSIDDDQSLYLRPLNLPTGGTLQYNRVMSAGAEDLSERFTWTALAEMPRYAVDADAQESFIDISSSGTALGLTTSGVADVDLPFAVNYFGLPYSQDTGYRLCVHNSGSLRLWRGVWAGSADCPRAQAFNTPPFVGDNLRIDGDYTDGILPYWDLLGDNGDVYVQTVGTAPQRRLIVQWNRKDHADWPSTNDTVTFEAIIDERDGRIHFVYQDVHFGAADPGIDDGNSATIGLLGHDADLQGRAAPPLHAGQSIVWTPTPLAHVASAETRLHVGTPRVQALPQAIHAAALADTHVTRPLRIGNAGNLTLDWSLARARPDAHFPATQRWIAALDKPPAAADRGPLAAPMQKPSAEPLMDTASFTVPAYGAKLEHTLNDRGSVSFEHFDIAAPNYFVPIPGDAYNIRGGDFVDDDFSREYVIYVQSVGPSTSEMLATWDTTSGELSAIGEMLNPSLSQRWSGMAWDRTTRTLFATTAQTGNQRQPCDDELRSEKSVLFSVDVATGAVTALGDIRLEDGSRICVTDIAIAPDGLMYGIDLHNDALLAIDKSNGRAATIGSLGIDLSRINSIDFDDVSGTLYLAAYHPSLTTWDTGGFYTIDLLTGRAQRVARYPFDANNGGYLSLDALAIARAGGRCAFPGDIPWLRFDTTEGRTPAGQQSNVTVTLDATGMATGRYAADVCISSNDRSRSLLSVPVELTVLDPADAIFRDDFEGTR